MYSGGFLCYSVIIWEQHLKNLMTALVHKGKVLSALQLAVIVQFLLNKNGFTVQKEKSFAVVIFKYLNTQFRKRGHSKNTSVIGQVLVFNI